MTLSELERRSGGRLGVCACSIATVVCAWSGAAKTLRHVRPSLLLAAIVLREVDAGRLSLETRALQ